MDTGIRARHPQRASRGVSAAAIVVSAVLLLWPAAWNGYPIVFADTGTYLSQAVHRYLGWDRPVFYSLFMLPLHLTLTTWPVVVAQAVLAAVVLHLTRCLLLPGVNSWILVPFALFLSVTTWLPWLVSELMPDVFTPLLVLILSVLVLGRRPLVPDCSHNAVAAHPHRHGPACPGHDAEDARGTSMVRTITIIPFAAFLIAAQQSSVPLALAVLAVLGPLRWWLDKPRWRQIALPWLAPALAIAALATVSAAGHGRAAVSPYGNVFLLARVIYDGPGMIVLHRDCPGAGWRLCPFLDRFPASSDEFLWRADSPVILAGGHKAVSTDADAIILSALRAEPAAAARAGVANAWEQLTRFTSGDGLETWPDQITPWIARDFPARELAAYAAARQQNGTLTVPPWLAAIHRVTALLGIAVCCLLFPMAAWRRHRAVGLLAAVLVTLPASALITGALSGPHDRYQSRVMWLAPCAALLCAPALFRRPA